MSDPLDPLRVALDAHAEEDPSVLQQPAAQAAASEAHRLAVAPEMPAGMWDAADIQIYAGDAVFVCVWDGADWWTSMTVVPRTWSQGRPHDSLRPVRWQDLTEAHRGIVLMVWEEIRAWNAGGPAPWLTEDDPFGPPPPPNLHAEAFGMLRVSLEDERGPRMVDSVLREVIAAWLAPAEAAGQNAAMYLFGPKRETFVELCRPHINTRPGHSVPLGPIMMELAISMAIARDFFDGRDDPHIGLGVCPICAHGLDWRSDDVDARYRTRVRCQQGLSVKRTWDHDDPSDYLCLWRGSDIEVFCETMSWVQPLSLECRSLDEIPPSVQHLVRT